MIAAVLLGLTASAAQPWEAAPEPEPFTAQLQWSPEVPHSQLQHSAAPETTEHRDKPTGLRRAGRVVTYTGIGTMAAAVPAGLAVYGVGMSSCEEYCLRAPVGGAITTSLMLTSGSLTALAGVVTSAIGRDRERRRDLLKTVR